MIAHVHVDDAEAYEDYKRANAKPFAEFGARFLVRGGEQTQVEGQGHARTVVIEFPTIEAAHACYASAEYQAAKKLRDDISIADTVIVEGYDA